MDNPLDWFKKMAGKGSDLGLKLQFVEAFQEPQALLFVAESNGVKVIFSPFSPNEVRQKDFARRGKLSSYGGDNPLFSLPRRITVREISILNAGILFDLELPLAWKGLTGQDTNHMERLWMYMI